MPEAFSAKLLWIFIPYACMEAAYTVMSHFLPVRESVDAITPTVLLDKIFLHPDGGLTGYLQAYTDSVQPHLIISFLCTAVGCLRLL